MELLEWGLRLFGIFWLLGGYVTLRAARRAALMDTVLEAITLEKEDRLVSRFLTAGAVLTMLSGLGLAIASVWALLPLVLLVCSQLIYFDLQRKRFARAESAEEREQAQVADSTRNAFNVSLVVLLTALAAWGSGVLR